MMTLNHGFSGFVCGRVALPLLRRHSPLSARGMGWAFFLGAMLPDLDIVSKTMGRMAYFSGEWYAHRQLSHSLLGTLLMALLAGAVFSTPVAQRFFSPPPPASAGAEHSTGRWKALYPWWVACFWAGGLIHLFGDLFTPGMSMPILWPLDLRYGGLSHIGWFSPYLLWLFLFALLAKPVLELIVPGGPRAGRGRNWRGLLLWAVHAGVAAQWVGFLLTSRYESQSQWMEYQRTLLPEAMITPLNQGVRQLWYWLSG